MAEDNWEGLIEENWRTVFITCYGILRHKEDAEDITIEVMTKFYQLKGLSAKGEPIENPRLYLKQMARSKARNLAAKKAKGPTCREDIAEIAKGTSGNEGEYRLLWEDFEKATDSILTNRERQVYWLRIQGYDLKEIPPLLEISYYRVNELMVSAKKKIKDWYRGSQND
ncbi:MAG: sigma-70 family RNA polymerase sigma factor [Bacteroidota bacterium]